MRFISRYHALVLSLGFCLTGTAQIVPFFGAEETIEIVRKEESFFHKGRIEVFDSSSTIIAKGKVLLGKRHGKWMLYESDKEQIRVRYKFGVLKSQLKTSTGKRTKLLLLIGKPMFFPKCQKGTDEFKLHAHTVAGCRVNNKILFRVGWHNFFVTTSLVMKHGFNWEEKYREICRPLKQ